MSLIKDPFGEDFPDEILPLTKSRYVDEILVEKQGCCSPQEGLVDYPDIRQVEAWGKLPCENLDSRC